MSYVTLKNVTFTCLDGSLDMTGPQFEHEADISQLIVDFTGCGVDSWSKFVDLKLNNNQGVPLSLGTGLIGTVPIQTAWLIPGRIALQAYAVGPEDQRVYFEIKHIPVNRSLNIVGSDSEYDPSALLLLQNLYAALEARVVTNEEDIAVLEYVNHYVHDQMASSATWVITHNMNKFPSVQVVNNFNEVVIGNVTFDSVNQITLTFSGAFSGKAYLN
jgi:hypothetical protein